MVVSPAVSTMCEVVSSEQSECYYEYGWSLVHPFRRMHELQDMKCSAWISVSRRGNEQKTSLEFSVEVRCHPDFFLAVATVAVTTRSGA
jgi:hypothetical protein